MYSTHTAKYQNGARYRYYRKNLFGVSICLETYLIRWTWFARSLRVCAFSVVEDQGFWTLMKTGQPKYYIPLGVGAGWHEHRDLLVAAGLTW